jgi:hypothetical protein
MMTPQRREQIAAVLEGLRSDIEADVSRRDGLPFNGATVAQALGEICAQVDALAHALIVILREDA